MGLLKLRSGIAALLLNIAGATSWAQPACVLDPFEYASQKDTQTFDSLQLTYWVQAKFIFALHDQLYDINETTYFHLVEFKNAVGDYMRERVQAVPSDSCGTVLGDITTNTDVVFGRLSVKTTIAAEQWRCQFGIRALLASGSIDILMSFAPTMVNGKVALTSKTDYQPYITSTIPDFIPQDLVDQFVNQFTVDGIGDVKSRVESSLATLNDKIDKVQNQTAADAEAVQPFYKPVYKSSRFIVDGSSIVLENVRGGQERRGNTCLLRRFLIEKLN
jgi:hypothetical protein